MLNNAALIVASGSGTRFGSSTPKQYHKLKNGRSVLEETISIFKSHPLIDLICIVIAEDHPVTFDCLYTYGGKTRQESVRNGLRFLKQYNPKNVLIHDGVRPFVPADLISQVIFKLKNYEAVDVGLPIVDTIKTYDGVVIPRETLYATETPQGFHFDLISELHENSTENYTDDVSLYIASGGKNLAVVPGDSRNIKITFKSDI